MMACDLGWSFSVWGDVIRPGSYVHMQGWPIWNTQLALLTL